LATRRFPRGTYSQGGQEGILDAIFHHVPVANAPPSCVEFGFNAESLAGGSGSNVARLVLERGWRPLLFDDIRENAAIGLRREAITPANAVDVFRRWHVPRTPDYVSIDIDSTDLWVFRALLPCYRASVYSVEYNSHFPLEATITFADEPAGRWQGDRGYGASLGALTAVAGEHGYSLVAVEPMLDAFFVRDDLLEDGSGRLALELDHWRSMTSLTHHAAIVDPSRVDSFVDYRVWRETGDPAAARSAAAEDCRRCLFAPPTSPGILRRGLEWVRRHGGG
jgi:hypothetical protein